MAVLGIYAGANLNNLTLLPSPISCDPSKEIIWSENTGRAQSGANKAKMIGDVVAEKRTYNIKWDMLTSDQMALIDQKLPAGFFAFGVGTSATDAKNKGGIFYRSEIASNIMQVTSTDYRYRNVTVTVIEQ